MNLLIKEVSLKGELLSNRLNAKLETEIYSSVLSLIWGISYHTQFKPSVPGQVHKNGPSLPCVSDTQFVRWGSEHYPPVKLIGMVTKCWKNIACVISRNNKDKWKYE